MYDTPTNHDLAQVQISCEVGQSFDCMIFTLHDLTDFYIERVTAQRSKIYDHSYFHNLWPNSKTNIKLKHIWEQGGPLVFRGPTQLAYSAYREDWLCLYLCIIYTPFTIS